MATKPRPRRPRDPSWRMRRALRPKRIESAKSYDRKAERAVSRNVQPEPDGPPGT